MLTNAFLAACKEYAKKKNDVLDESFEDSKKICSYRIEFFRYSVEFRYVKKETGFFKPSSLYCVIRLRKNSTVYYHLTDIIPFLEQKTFKSCYFWHMESPERLNNCFESLTEILENVTSQLTPFLSDDKILSDALFDSYRMLFKLKETDLNFEKIDDLQDYAHTYFCSLQNWRDGYLFSRYCNFAPYALLLKNKVDKALDKYQKLAEKNKLLEYEKHLIHHITHSESREFQAFDASCNTSAAEKHITPLTWLLAFATVFSISSAFFCGIFALYNFIISMDTLVVLAAPWYAGFVCAGLCSVFGTIALVANKPHSKKGTPDFSNVLISKGVKKLATVVFVLSIAVSIFFAVMILIANVRFYEDKITFGNRSYGYEQVHSVYYIEARYNVYGDRIQRGSYVILFHDKTSLDLDGSASISFMEEEVLPILKEKGFEIKTADSEKELPWYTEE